DLVVPHLFGQQLAEYLGYSTPNLAAQQLLPEEVRNNEVIYPKTNVFELNDVQVDIKEATELYDRIWTEIKSQ
ncbi:MAG TPA: spermidine/putrescine ABC transporter substrate-binding protein PotD, partial [Bacillota bacterium]|nr:spermidine/putrescine ABC transporter substrate-binding protein PotD [Bacillota bacterium]